MRAAALRVAEGSADRVRVDAADLETLLGPAPVEHDVGLRSTLPGVATGLAWTPAGGDILFVEATRVAGSGRLILTGQLGEVMKESAQAALKEKVLAAQRAGLRTVLLPARNRKDLHDVPDSTRQALQFVWLETVDDAVGAALAERARRPAQQLMNA